MNIFLQKDYNEWAPWVTRSTEFRIRRVDGAYVSIPLVHVWKYVGRHTLNFYLPIIGITKSSVYLGNASYPKNHSWIYFQQTT